MEKWANTKKEYKFCLVVLLFSIFILVLSVTYALWRQNFIGQKENEISTATTNDNDNDNDIIDDSDEETSGNLSIELINENNSIFLDKAIPVSDEVGMSYIPYTFQIKNNGIRAGYNIYLRDDDDAYKSSSCLVNKNGTTTNICLQNKMDWRDIKFSVVEDDNNDDKVIDILGRDNGHIYTSSIKSKQTKSYKLRIWIKSEANMSVMGKYFYGKISVEATPY